MAISKRPLTDKDGNVRTLGRSDFKRGRKASEVLPESLKAQLGVPAEPVSWSSVAPFTLRVVEVTYEVGDAGDFRKVGEKAARHFEEELKSAAHSLVMATPG